jgi:arylsulfatase A-like enzyme
MTIQKHHSCVLATLPILSALLVACGDNASKPVPRPNIVFVVVDTLRGDVLTDPNNVYSTPHLDALAADGILFPKTFSHAPLTLPSHTAIFSSRPPIETVVFKNGQQVPTDLPLLAEWLTRHGYETRAVTSLGTLWAPKDGTGLWRGFQDYDLDYWHMSQAERSTDRIRSSLDQRAGDRPLFLFAHYSDPHEPYNAHGEVGHTAEIYCDGELIDTVTTSEMSFWRRSLTLSAGRHIFEVRSKDRFKVRQFQSLSEESPRRWSELEWVVGKRVKALKHVRLSLTQMGDGPVVRDLRLWINDVPGHDVIRARYASEVAYVDRWIGELLDDLKQRGIYDESLIVFTSDHGESLGEHGRVGHANGLTDPHIHVPLIVKPPKSDPRRSQVAENSTRLVSHADVTPTILELACLPALPGQLGTSLLRESDAVHFAQTHRPEAKLDQLCLRDEHFKMIYLPKYDEFFFYDLESDPGELDDVYTTRRGERADWPERLRALARLAAERAKNGYTPDAGKQADLEALGYGGGD